MSQQDQDVSERRARAVAAPVAHEGVGAALRTAYLPRASDMPRDIADLIDRLR